MKIRKLITTLMAAIIFAANAYSQGVGINNNGSQPDASSMLDVVSTTKGVLFPRLTTNQMTSIASPAMGLTIFNTDSVTFCFYDGSVWRCLCTSPCGGTTGVPPIANAGADATICMGDSTVLTAGGGDTYQWSTGSTTTSITVKPNITTTYTVTATNAYGTDSDEVVVTVINPVANAGIDITICNGSTTTLTATGGGSYNWNTGSTYDTTIVSPILTTTYTVTVTVGSCADTDDVVVTITPLPTANAGADITIASGQSTTLTATGGGSYNWSTGSAYDTTIVNPTTTTTYTVTVTDANNCTDTDEIIVTVPGCTPSTVTFTYRGSTVTYGVVLSNGECWLDRNLGASQVATSKTDAAAYGDLFQWGRLDDGHQDRSSSTTSTLSATDNPGNSLFITNTALPYDWRNPQNNALWQGVGGTNNPCPAGFRLPTEAEFVAEEATWNPPNPNSDGGYNSPLKLTVGGWRNDNGNIWDIGSIGFYWTSTISGGSAKYMLVGGPGGITTIYRDRGHSVRCIKD